MSLHFTEQGLRAVKILTLVGFTIFADSTLAATGATESAPPPAPVQEWLKLLNDPVVREWLNAQKLEQPPTQIGSSQSEQDQELAVMSRGVNRVREHLTRMVLAISQMPAELVKAGTRLGDELMEWGVLAVAVLVGAFLGLGIGARWVFSIAAAPMVRWISKNDLSQLSDRLLAMLFQLIYLIGGVAAFAVGSLAAFTAFEWPPTLKEILINYLAAGLTTGLAWVVLTLLLAPASMHTVKNPERLRVIPLSNKAASYWSSRLVTIVGWFAFGWASVYVHDILDVDDDVRQVVAYALGLVLLALGIAAVWQQPATGPEARTLRKWKWFFSLVFLLLWLLWIAGTMHLFWLLAVAVGLPFAIALEKRAVAHVLQAPDTNEVQAKPSVSGTILERGLRLVLILAAVAVLAWSWEVDYGAMGKSESMQARLALGALAATAILIVADFIWNVVKSAIAVALAKANAQAIDPHTDAGHRQSRIRTLLPIMRIALLGVIGTIAVLMALSELGVQIAPLIAGAGIVGVAIGFGSQTLVRDIISGVFYLLDDAFRIGEYIQSGNYKGTVESFGLRSVQLRHQRGAVNTIPYGLLGAIQNLSRDWVIDKIKIGITYDSDVDKARKIIKKIGLELAEDPEFKHSILQPLKMQGVDSFGDFAIEIILKMMTRPGEQFDVRRRALSMIKTEFNKAGVKFAFPTVQIAAGVDATQAAAAAYREIDGQKPADEN